MVLVMIVFLIVLISYGNVKDEGMTIVGIGTSKVRWSRIWKIC